MPRGDKEGSIRQTESGFIVRKRYTDLYGTSREKKRIVDTRSEAERVLRKIGDEVAAELMGIEASQRHAFAELVSCCYSRDANTEPAHHLAATLLNLESGLECIKKLLPELEGIGLKDFCNQDRFKPARFARSLMNRLNAGLMRVKDGATRILVATETTTNQTDQLQIPRWVGNNLQERIVNSVWPKGVNVICPSCLAQQYLDVEQAAECLAEGWPKCCGRTMQVEDVK